ncbi:MAG: hypothetical protein IJX97_01795 [Clostridia bacterium]|nr:hypothetical protein [Clostridia bacterium]
MTKHKTSFTFLETFAVLTALLHFIFLSISTPMVDTQSMLLILLAYGLPIWVFACARNDCIDGKPSWSKSGFITMALFTLTFIAMSVHVTLAYFLSNEAYINVYFNMPIIYSALLLLFSILWAGTKNSVKNAAGQGIIGKIITRLPATLVVFMTVNVIVVSVIEILNQSGDIPSTSAPWWVSPLIIALCYIVAIGISLLIRRAYNSITANK